MYFLHYIGPTGATTFYGAALHPDPEQPDEFHVIVYLRLVLLLFFSPSIILTDTKTKFFFYFEFYSGPHAPAAGSFDVSTRNSLLENPLLNHCCRIP